jgi:hypothetical protein
LKAFELGGGLQPGADVAFGRIGGEPAEQVVAQALGQGVVGAVLQAGAAAVKGGLGGGGRPA